MNLKPINKNVIVQRLEKKMESSGGIILKTSEEADKAKVIAVSDEVTDVHVDEVVLINWNKAQKITEDNWNISVDDIVLVFEE